MTAPKRLCALCAGDLPEHPIQLIEPDSGCVYGPFCDSCAQVTALATCSHCRAFITSKGTARGWWHLKTGSRQCAMYATPCVPVPVNRPHRAVPPCGQIVHYGSGDRYSHAYCDDLPAGHSGKHIFRPTRQAVTEAWIEALTAAGWVTATDSSALVSSGPHQREDGHAHAFTGVCTACGATEQECVSTAASDYSRRSGDQREH